MIQNGFSGNKQRGLTNTERKILNYNLKLNDNVPTYLFLVVHYENWQSIGSSAKGMGTTGKGNPNSYNITLINTILL